MKHKSLLVPLIQRCTLVLVFAAVGVAPLCAAPGQQENAPAVADKQNLSTTSNKKVAMPKVINPVWEDINSRYSPKELFEKIMNLANKPTVTPSEVEKTFGITFDPPKKDSPPSNLVIYNAKGDLPRSQRDLSTRGFSLFVQEKHTDWTLNLSGLSSNKEDGDCILFGYALQTIIEIGWKEVDAMEPETRNFYYVKDTDNLWSRIYIGYRGQIRNSDCLREIQIWNRSKSKH